MKLLIFSIYDQKAKSWSRPHFGEKVGNVVRQFGDIASDKQHPIGQHPEDYALYQIGQWDDDKGEIKMDATRTSLGMAQDFVKSSPSGIKLEGKENEEVESEANV